MYRKTRRGGKGVITIKIGERNGNVISVKAVADDDEVIFTSVNGMVIRIPVHDIRLQSRATLGVRLMRLKDTDRITAVARLVGIDEEERMVDSARTLTRAPTEDDDVADGDEAADDEEDEDDEEVTDESDDGSEGDGEKE
jgi:DNA gyrase subunit A